MGGSLTMNIITLASLLLSSLVLIQGKGFGAALNGGKSLNGPELSVNEKSHPVPVQRMSRIVQEAYPNWVPTTQAHHDYEQLYQEAFPVVAWTYMVNADLIQMRSTGASHLYKLVQVGYWSNKEVLWNQN